ncbi:hypothetical protein COLO4_03564 [Corchorus olitorius]|uniref:Uncharacterized protein n=1 Tax=Corchorus olitorius TaxID=93759 RepID=A0A1R3KY64_9ROSI|nr:hypothetical protein COLO4_03564 [Corchorus olitorius]
MSHAGRYDRYRYGDHNVAWCFLMIDTDQDAVEVIQRLYQLA